MFVQSEKTQGISNRIYTLQLFFLVMSLVLILQCFNLQMINYRHYNDLSLHNYLKATSIMPSRGKIVDRNGHLLVENKVNFSAKVTKKNRPLIESILKEKTHSDLVPLSHKTTIKIKENSELADKVDILSTRQRKYYDSKEMFSVIGYGSFYGQEFKPALGIEKYYDDILKGQPGYDLLKVSARGSLEKTGKSIPPVNGATVTLTIDRDLQKFVHKTLRVSKGAVVVMNPNNGEVLALVSQPSLDSNQIPNMYQNNNPLLKKNQPEFNRVISGLISPGSTIKPIIALSALENNVIKPSYRIQDHGHYVVANHVFHDWVPKGHGIVDLEKAIMVSCDTYFYILAKKMGINLISNAFSEFGLGQKTGIDLPNESSGLVPTPEWKQFNRGASWYVGDTIITTIGQGALLSTPIQLACVTALISNEGFYYVPHLLKGTTDISGHQHQPSHIKKVIRDYDPKHYELIKRSMKKVISDPNGTGHYYFRNRSYSVAGKTGTTQITSHHSQRADAPIPLHLENHSLFIGYAPVDHPQVIVVTIVENSELSAATVSRKILDFYFKHMVNNDEIKL
mgnify:CR=1 FL=1